MVKPSRGSVVLIPFPFSLFVKEAGRLNEMALAAIVAQTIKVLRG